MRPPVAGREARLSILATIGRTALWPLRKAVDLALPPRCAGCGEMVGRDGDFCAPCWAGIGWLGEGCDRCGQPLLVGEEARCRGCAIEGGGPLDRRRAACAYGEASRRIAIGLKYGRKVGHARLMARAMGGKFDAALASREEGARAIVMPVPLHRARLWRRGFNQALLVGAALKKGREGAVEIVPDLVERTRATRPLKAMSHAERRREVAGAFAVHRRWRERLEGRDILIIDDVVTSGATAEACARALKAAGARRVELIAWAMVVQEARLVR